MRTELRLSLKRISVLPLLIFALLACAVRAQSPATLLPGPKPPDAPSEWKQLVGIYLDEDSKHSFVLLEQDGKLFWRDDKGKNQAISVFDGNIFLASEGQPTAVYSMLHDEAGNVTGFCYLNFCYRRTDAGSDPSHPYHVTPSRSVETLRREALAATPPKETGNFRKPDLAELAPLDASIHLDIRYATSNDFLGTPVYSQARAFLQRPAAEALPVQARPNGPTLGVPRYRRGGRL